MEFDAPLPPESPLEPTPVTFRGHPLPFEDKANVPGFFDRIARTYRVFWADPAAAGEGLAAQSNAGPAAIFYAIVGLPVVILVGLAQVFFPVQLWFQSMLHTPKPAAQEGLALIGGVIGVLLLPIFIALSFLLIGVLNHAGLWMVGGSKEKLGLGVTFRTVIYAAATLSAPIALAEMFLQRLPGVLGTGSQILTIGAQLGIFFYQGVIFARAHRTDTWRGVVGMLIPVLLLVLFCGGCIGGLLLIGGDEIRDAFMKGLQGGA